MRIVKSILLNIFTGATVTTTVAMVAVAYSDRIHPVDHPLLACVGLTFPFFLILNLILLMVWIMVCWRRAWIVLAGFLLSYPSIRIYVPLHFEAELPEDCIKVVSYNVANYTMDKVYKNPFDSVYAFLERQNADIVCLQEDCGKKNASMRSMETLYPYNDTVHLNMPSIKSVNAVGIHTRYPILRKERINYESRANGSVAFFLLIDRDTVIVVNNHLESNHLSEKDRKSYNDMITGGMNREDTEAETKMLLNKLSESAVQRAPQAEAVHRYVEAHRGYPIILCGDFNDNPISYARRTIAEGLTDCYVESGNGPGITFYQRGFFFRIDQIMCSSHFTPYNCYVDNRVKGSDHYPVICWLKKNGM